MTGRRLLGLVLVVAAVGGVSPAASAADDPPFRPLPPAQPIPPGGVAAVQKTVLRTVRGAGSVGSAVFSVDLSKGPGGKVRYADERRSVMFRSIRLRSVRFGTGRATLHGVGLLNGRRVAFTAVAVDHGPRGDVFRIAWSRGTSHGGVLLSGALAVR